MASLLERSWCCSVSDQFKLLLSICADRREWQHGVRQVVQQHLKAQLGAIHPQLPLALLQQQVCKCNCRCHVHTISPACTPWSTIGHNKCRHTARWRHQRCAYYGRQNRQVGEDGSTWRTTVASCSTCSSSSWQHGGSAGDMLSALLLIALSAS